MEQVKAYFEESIEVKKAFLSDEKQCQTILEVADQCVQAILKGKKILICGNGGSASDAQHFAGEIVGRFRKERKAYGCVCLNTDTSVMTAIANDYGYDVVFSRQVEGVGCEGDIFIGISTSGNSGNVINAIEMCKTKGIKTVAIAGGNGGKMAGMCDYSLVVPTKVTSHIQETHIAIVHILCKIIEEKLVENEK